MNVFHLPASASPEVKLMATIAEQIYAVIERYPMGGALLGLLLTLETVLHVITANGTTMPPEALFQARELLNYINKLKCRMLDDLEELAGRPAEEQTVQ